ncbi:MAG: hypothetical protein QG604_446, partial [Candidatus Dependentiae bacterium]|nr:hypothetical protein [Candidatus Dependentiae bacterium]
MNKYHAFLLTIAITNLLSPVHAGVSAATGLGFLVTAGLGYKGYQSYQKMSSAARRFKKIASSERGEMLKKARSEFHRYLASGSVAACITLVLLFKVLSDRDAEKDRVAIALAQATREQADRERAEREQAEA